MAAELARRFDAELVLISAYPPGRPRAATGTERDWASNPSARQRAAVDRAEAKLREEGVRARTLVAEGEPADVLVDGAAKCGADVLVVGNKGMDRRVLGSVPNSVTHKAGRSVLVVKT